MNNSDPRSPSRQNQVQQSDAERARREASAKEPGSSPSNQGATAPAPPALHDDDTVRE